MFGIGWLELLIFVALLGGGVVVVVTLVLSASKRNLPMPDNLTPCPDCQHSVSIRAQTCPHCGAPLKPSA